MSTRWVTASALKALAAQRKRAGEEFTAGELALWTRSELTPDQRVHASTRLCGLGFVRHHAEIILGERVDVYTITDDGAAAIQAAAQGEVRKSGPKDTRAPNPVRPDDLSSRLWTLLRMRKVLDTDAAARTLCDAGDDFERMRATVGKTLRRWEMAVPDAVQASQRRVPVAGQSKMSNGAKRYVLVKDLGPTPPRWRPVLKAKGAVQ
jgi:hypothetical protein